MPASEFDPDRLDLPDELVALRAAISAPADQAGGRAARASRSAAVFLQERRRRLRRELAAGTDPADRGTRPRCR